MASLKDKARFMECILYPENMVENWADIIDEVLEIPFAYCVHDSDLEKDSKDSSRKKHIHLIMVFNNTTTLNYGLGVANCLSLPGKKAASTIQAIKSMRSAFDYLIHDTDKCREQGKHLYAPECRVCGNNFDIGFFEQLDSQTKNEYKACLCMDILNENISNFADFYIYVLSNYDSSYLEIVNSNSGLFARLTKGVYQRQLTSNYVKEVSDG